MRRKARSPTPEENIDQAFDMMRDIIARPEAYPDEFIVLPLDPDIISKVLSPERIRLLHELRAQGPFSSVNELADCLGRDQSRVSRDVADLVEMGLVKSERDGKSKRVSASKKPIWLV